MEYKQNMSPKEESKFEEEIRNEYLEHKSETDKDLAFRLKGVPATRGSSGYQLVGYETLSQFYRGDQWDHDEPPGASQKTDNYCAVVVDNFSSLLFDAPVEINCKSQDEADDVLELLAEIKEKLLNKVYEENDADDIIFPELSKIGSLYGDSFIKGPFLDKNGSKNKKDWKIVFHNVENPANIRPIFDDENYKKLYGFIDNTAISPMKAVKLYKDKMFERGLSIEEMIKKANAKSRTGMRNQPNINDQQTYQKMLFKNEYWTDKFMAIFLEDELIDYWYHDWGFVPLEFIKNNHIPNHPYGKSDIEDILDPQLAHTQTNNDLANALKFLSTINLKGKNLDGMEVLVHGLSKIFNLPDEGELDPIQRAGDPYAARNYVEGRRGTILDISGVAEALMSSGGGGASGRAMSMALQSVIRKLNPKIKRHQKALRSVNKNIFILMEKYWPETKEVIMGDYSSEVSIISTLLRNIIDELNKMQSGVQSLTTTQTNIGVPQPKIEQKRMKRDLMDPILGPQTARQPGMLQVQMQGPEQEPGAVGEDGNQLPPAANQGGTIAGPEGAVAGANQRAGGGAPVPNNPITP